MKKAIILSAIVLAVISLQFTSPQTRRSADPSLVKKWETDSVLKTPESVLLDPGKNLLYVSNINGKPGEKDGNGFISKVTLEGKVEKLEWVKGLDAPKGMGLYKNMLYVADLTKLIVIDTDLGEVVNSIEVEGAQFLNDVTVDAKGGVYISDSNTKKIHKFENNRVTLWHEQSDLIKINGLLALAEQLFYVDMGTGKLYSIGYKDKTPALKGEGLTSGDGIVMVGKNEFLVSNWNGEINYLNNQGKVYKLLDTKDKKINAADIEFAQKEKLVFIPTFFKNSVSAYEFKK